MLKRTSVMRTVFLVFVGATWLLAAVPATPHHSFAAEFDINRPVKLTGTITRIEWTNPHSWLFIDTEDDDGNVQNWAIELISTNGLLRRGWTRDKVRAGDIVNVEGFGARDGTNTGNATTVIMTDTGERLWDSASAQ
jgi:DNA/RNA endonuclease YhcR with UshA esterase domain